MSTRNAPSTNTQTTVPEALVTTQKWSRSRGVNVMDLATYPGIMVQDTFAANNSAWFGIPASGAAIGSIVYPNTNFGNSDPNSLKVTAGASGAASRYCAIRKFDITPAKKLGFNVFFCYDNPANVASVILQMQWRDVDHGFNHIAAFRYNVGLQTWQYLPSTSASASGAFNNLANGATTLASGAGAWHEAYFDVDFGNNNYDEFIAGQVGISTPGMTGIPILQATEPVEAQRMEVLLGVESTGGLGPATAWFDDIAIFEVD